MREQRLVSRYRKKLGAMLSTETNRLHKLLDDDGIKLCGLVEHINGKGVQAIIGRLKSTAELIKKRQGKTCWLRSMAICRPDTGCY